MTCIGNDGRFGSHTNNGKQQKKSKQWNNHGISMEKRDVFSNQFCFIFILGCQLRDLKIQEPKKGIEHPS